jgi:hypothetical protein
MSVRYLDDKVLLSGSAFDASTILLGLGALGLIALALLWTRVPEDIRTVLLGFAVLFLLAGGIFAVTRQRLTLVFDGTARVLRLQDRGAALDIPFSHLSHIEVLEKLTREKRDHRVYERTSYEVLFRRETGGALAIDTFDSPAKAAPLIGALLRVTALPGYFLSADGKAPPEALGAPALTPAHTLPVPLNPAASPLVVERPRAGTALTVREGPDGEVKTVSWSHRANAAGILGVFLVGLVFLFLIVKGLGFGVGGILALIFAGLFTLLAGLTFLSYVVSREVVELYPDRVEATNVSFGRLALNRRSIRWDEVGYLAADLNPSDSGTIELMTAEYYARLLDPGATVRDVAGLLLNTSGRVALPCSGLPARDRLYVESLLRARALDAGGQ